MTNVTWRRFDQSAAQLIVGLTTVCTLLSSLTQCCFSTTVHRHCSFCCVFLGDHCQSWYDGASLGSCCRTVAGNVDQPQEERPVTGRSSDTVSLVVDSVQVSHIDLLSLPSVLWCLDGRKGIQPVKNWAVGCWHGYLSGARCRLASQLMPLPLTVSCFSKIQIDLPFWCQLTRVVPDKGLLNGCVLFCLTTYFTHSPRSRNDGYCTPCYLLLRYCNQLSQWQ